MRDLSGIEIEEFLREEIVGRIACAADGELYLVPIIYAYDEGSVVVLTSEGRKTRMMRANPEVCFEVDRYDGETGSWRSVVAYGRYEELTGPDAEAARTLLAERFEERTGRRRERPGGGGAVPFVAFRITLARKSGRAVER